MLVGLGLHLLLQAAFATVLTALLPLARTALVGVLLTAFFGLQRGLVGTQWDALGLRPLRRWSLEERLYLIQVVPIAAIVFAVVFRDRLGGLLAQHGTLGFALYSVATGLAWGMVQECLYRGWLQNALVHRWGAAVGVLVSNTLFTLGPLHASLYLGRSDPQWATLAAVFGIGLLFAVLYRRSGNLWLPALLHGLWPLNMS
jgi:membrane protease YdiL (CAAX protease family)